ncbi:MAG: hypothetical protein HFI21_03425 [Lachnospiraceae bacterium]|nr:hypothetical protein [Lachnospiraceae bacterium]
MELNSLIQHMKLSRNKSVIVDRCIPKEYPGYVRTITIMQNSIARVEFEVYGYDEGGITYFIQYLDYECLVKNLEEYLTKKLMIGIILIKQGFIQRKWLLTTLIQYIKKLKQI